MLSKKRNDKLENKCNASSKSFGNALKGVPGTVFEVEGVKFTVLEEKDTGGNRMALCQCQTKVRRDNAKRHTENNEH